MRQFEPDLLDQLTRFFEVAVIGDADHQLVDDPIAALVLDRAQFAEGYSIEGATMVAKLDRPQAERFDRALEAAREELNEIVKASGNSEDSQHSKLVKFVSAAL